MLRPLVLALLLLALTAPAAAQRPPSPRMPPELLQPHLVEVALGRRLNIRCIGAGSPTIVFEQGGEGFLTNWKKVQPAATALTRPCFYDRAGFGYSDPPDAPVTALNVTDDLRALLQRAGERGPFVLVGHSIGGFYATAYADRFPEQVAGLVLVDAGWAGQVEPMTAERNTRYQGEVRRGEGYLLHCAELARTGRLTAANLAENKCVPLWPGSTPDEHPYMLHAILRPGWHLGEHSQSVHYFPSDDRPSVSWAQANAVRRAWGDLPVAVLSASKPSRASWETEAEAEAGHVHWLSGHRALAARSTRGRWTVVEGAGHFIQTDRPQAVIEAIRSVVGEARERR